MNWLPYLIFHEFIGTLSQFFLRENAILFTSTLLSGYTLLQVKPELKLKLIYIGAKLDLNKCNLSTYPYIIDTLIALAAEKHLLNNREEALILTGLEDKCAVAINLDIPIIKHVTRDNNRRSTVLQLERMLLIQGMTNSFVLEAIYGTKQYCQVIFIINISKN